MNIFRMAREGLRGDLTIALHRAVSLRIPIRHPGLHVKTNGDFTTVNLTVLPVPADPRRSHTSQGLFLVILEEECRRSLELSAEAAVDTVDGGAGCSPGSGRVHLAVKAGIAG